MLRVITPATTSNLGVGFDCLGMSLNIYNRYVFNLTLTKTFELYGFEEEFNKDNLVLNAYIACAKAHGKTDRTIAKISVTLEDKNIPVSRGLGSSASCIIAGAIAANHYNNLKLTKEEIAKWAADYEGHPDNVYACMFGGLVSIIKEENDYYFDNLRISKKLRFCIRIPNIQGSTEELRSVLPKKIDMVDAVHNLSRIIHLPKALEFGEISLIQKFTEDKYHEQYRAEFIPNYQELKSLALENNIVALISGSGPTMFFIADEENFSVLLGVSDTADELKSVKIGKGTTLKEF
ncbi:MAG: homoserine kinase [Tenericutes bacterium]|nr:homoserine kinase [Mycoplasmatota bacterium]